MYMSLNYKHLKQLDFLNILTQHLLLCKQGYKYKWKATNNFVIVKTKCQTKEGSLKIKINLLMQNSNRLMIQFKSPGNTKLQNSNTFSGLSLEEVFHCVQE